MTKHSAAAWMIVLAWVGALAGPVMAEPPLEVAAASASPAAVGDAVGESSPTAATVDQREVTFPGGAEGVELAGTLTLPAGASAESPAALVVLVTGSGPQDRDESIMGKKPFAALARDLSERGYAVLRYDDRGTKALGIGASTGSFSGATTRDFADDAAAAVAFARTLDAVDPDRIVVCGHSTGGLIAAKLLGDDEPIAAAVLLGAPAVRGADVLAEQTVSILRAMQRAEEAAGEADDGGGEAGGISDAYIDQAAAIQRALMGAMVSGDAEAQRAAAEDAVRFSVEQSGGDPADISDDFMELAAGQALRQLRDPWTAYFLTYDPGPDLRSMERPVLAVFGGADVQATPRQNLLPMLAHLRAGGHDGSRVTVLPNRNHLFQPSESGLPAEYPMLDGEMAGVGGLIADWLAGVLPG
jgi:hypothetical protein